MLASMRFATVISLAGIRISDDLVTSHYWRDAEVPRMLLAQRDAAAKQLELHGVAPDRRTGVFDLRTLDEAQHHEALYLGIRGVNRLDDSFLTAFQASQCATVACHKYLMEKDFYWLCLTMEQMIMIRITMRNRQFYG